MKTPFVVIIDGPMGAGKTTTSKLLNQKLEGTARIALSDVKRFISGFEKDHQYNRISQEIILVMVDEYLKRGISVIVEWAMKNERAESILSIAKEYSAGSHVFRLEAPKHILLERVKERTRMLLNTPNLTERNIQNIEDNFEANYKFHSENKPKLAIVFNSEQETTDEIVEQMLRHVK